MRYFCVNMEDDVFEHSYPVYLRKAGFKWEQREAEECAELEHSVEVRDFCCSSIVLEL